MLFKAHDHLPLSPMVFQLQAEHLSLSLPYFLGLELLYFVLACGICLLTLTGN